MLWYLLNIAAPRALPYKWRASGGENGSSIKRPVATINIHHGVAKISEEESIKA